MPDEKETPARPTNSKEEVALELMRFVATTTGFGRTGTGAGFSGKSPKTPEEQVDALLQLYERCRVAVSKESAGVTVIVDGAPGKPGGMGG